jgi:5'-nucleotidase
MRILITNDDGIHAPGLEAAERIARQLSDDVWIVAPEADQSGLAHSLTMNNALRLRQLGEKRFALSGTPTDCVIMGVRKVFGGEKPDLVLSGVNAGQNVADDISYSGTVAGAIEGTMLGIPSIALSQAYGWEAEERVVPWGTAEHFAPEIIQKLLDFGFEGGGLFNVNFPRVPPAEVAGTVVTAQGRLEHAIHVEERKDGRFNPYFWLTFRRRGGERLAGTDMHALEANQISITALRIDMTDAGVNERLSRHFG